VTTVASEPAGKRHSGVVTAAGALEGTLRVPADKSVAHRALILNAMGRGEAEVTLYRPGGDVLSTIEALRTLGAVATVSSNEEGQTRVLIRGGGDGQSARLPGSGDEDLDCGNSGTAMRLFAGALAGRAAAVTLSGDPSLSSRPMDRIATPLHAVGVEVETHEGHAPLRIHGRRPLRAVRHELPVASAQVLGSLALAGLAADGTTSIVVPGPTRDHTERMLGWLGAPIERDGLTTSVTGPSTFAARSMTAPGDISSAAAWLVAGALHPHATIRLDGVGLNPSRIGIIDVLRDMGADIELAPDGDASAGPEPVGSITVRGGRRLKAIDIAGDRVADIIDELPLISVAMAAADGVSELREAGELRVKESDRIALVVANQIAIGADVQELPDGWRIGRGTPRAAGIRTAGDHRIAMAFAIAALAGVAAEVRIDDPACAAISYPTFWTDMERLAR